MPFASTVQQIAFADKVLLNKLDLVTDDLKQAVIKRIRVSVLIQIRTQARTGHFTEFQVPEPSLN